MRNRLHITIRLNISAGLPTDIISLLVRLYLRQSARSIQIRPSPSHNDCYQGPEYQLVIHQLRHSASPKGRLTRTRRTWVRKPWSFGVADSHCNFATHAGILTSDHSSISLRDTFNVHRTLPYHFPTKGGKIRSFGSMFQPRWILGAYFLRLVSCYAFFKGWLLLSRPPRCLRKYTSFPTKHAF